MSTYVHVHYRPFVIISQDKRMSAADTTLMTRQREMLLQKLDEFERTNKALRRLLREQQATEVLSAFKLHMA